MGKLRYVCDPNRGQECSSTAACFKNGGTCYITECIQNAAKPVSTVIINAAYDKLVMRLLHERACMKQIAAEPVTVEKPEQNILATLGILGVVE